MTWTWSARHLLAQEPLFPVLSFEPGGFARHMVVAGTRWPELGYSRRHLEEEAGTQGVGSRQAIECDSYRCSALELQEDKVAA